MPNIFDLLSRATQSIRAMAKAAIFFGSDYASVVTGAALDVNGGEYMPI